MGDGYNNRNSFPIEDLPDYIIDFTPPPKRVEKPPPKVINEEPPTPPPLRGFEQPPPKVMGKEQPPPQLRGVEQPPPQVVGVAHSPPKVMGVEQPPPQLGGVEEPPPKLMGVEQSPPKLRVKTPVLVLKDNDEDEDDEEEEEEEEEKPREPSMLRIVLHHCLTNGGLLIFLVCYTCMGAAVFQHLEAPEEERKAEALLNYRRAQREIFLQNCKDIVRMARRDEIQWRNMTSSFLELYEHDLGVIVVETEENPLSSWNFYGSMFFATTVLTTIGYGNIAPVTPGGRVFCMVYAVFGIALLLLVLASIGTLLARGATMGYRKILKAVKKKRGKNRDETDVVTFQRDPRAQEIIDDGWKNGEEGDSHTIDLRGKNGESTGAVEKRDSANIDLEGKHEEQPEEEAQIPLTFVLIFAFLYICILAGLLKGWEDQWNYFEAFYFSFITLTTIGFGDLVPHHQKNLLACTFFILLGMAIMSMCIALAQEMIIQKVAWLSKKIGVAFASRKQKPGDDSS